MSELYIDKLTPPKDVAGHKPGRLPDGLLSKVDGGRLHWLAANAWKALKAAAAAEGVELKPTSAGDLYRSYDAQLKVFLERYTKEPNGNSTRTFEGVKWYKKSEKLASLAAPGTSQHNSGLAVDVHTASGERLKWMIANCRKFGWSWEVVPEEPWHIRYTKGDDVPEAVKAWMDANPAEVCKPGEVAAPAAEPAAAPRPITTPAVAPQSGGEAVKRGKANAASNPILQVGSSGAAVRTLQQLLNKAGVKCATDGDFGPKTEQAVKEFQKKVGLEETGIVNHKTWAKVNP
jgi:hypothetical protein